MKIFLPLENTNVEEVLNQCTVKRFDEIVWTDIYGWEVDVKVPKMCLENKFDLRSVCV